MELVRRSNPAFRHINYPGLPLSQLAPELPSNREPGASFHWIFGSDNPNDTCLVTGKRAHPNLRPYIKDGGAGYTVPPTVTLPGGAVGNAVLLGSSVKTTITNGGTGYPTPTQITLTATGGTYAPGGHPPVLKAITVAGGVITAIATVDPGAGILVPPTITVTAPSGTGAVITLTLPQGVRRITVTNGGTGYTSPPAVSVNGGTAGASLTASAFAIVAGGIVTAVYLFDCGFGYTSVPTITFTGTGTGAAATAEIGTNLVRCIELTDPGNQAPGSTLACTLTGGDGSIAATAEMMQSTGVYTRSANSLTIPSGGTNDTNGQNGLTLPLLDDGEFTLFVVAKIPAGSATGPIIMGTMTNAGSATGGFELKYQSSVTAYRLTDNNLILAGASLARPAGAVDGTYALFVYSVAPQAGESVTPSADKLQSYALTGQMGAAASTEVATGARPALSRRRLVSVGNGWNLTASFRLGFEVCEIIAFRKGKGRMTPAEIAGVRARSTARMAARNITLQN